MRNVFKAALVLAAVALLAAPALAQRPMGGGGGGLTGLLTNADVQKELKIEKEQMDKVTAALKKVSEDPAVKELIEKSRNRDTPREEQTEIRRKLTEATYTGLKDVLNEEQTKRLRQISFQQSARFRGVSVYTDPDVQKALKLTDAQIKDIKTISDEVAKERPQFGGGGGQEAFQKYQALVKEATEKVTKMLTDDQKKAYDELTGKPFELRFGPPGGNRPNPGQPRPPQ